MGYKKTSLAINLGLVYLILYIPLQIFAVLNYFYPYPALSLLNVLFATMINICFLFIIFSISAILKDHPSKGLEGNINAWVVLTVALIVSNVILPFDTDPSVAPKPWIAIFAIIMTFALGIMYLRLAKNFEPLREKYGYNANKAIKWSRIAGWLCVTLIFAPVGAFAQLFADYYIWRIIQQHSKAIAYLKPPTVI
jgi:hypothetical protein